MIKEGLTMSETTRNMEQDTLSTLYLAFELGNKQWKLGFTIGLGQRPRERTIAAGDLVAFQEEIRLAKKRFDLPPTARVMSCYEAGRDGFWLHRYLLSKDIENLVVDSASIEVNPFDKLRTGSGRSGPRPTAWIWPSS
jgi:transposase